MTSYTNRLHSALELSQTHSEKLLSRELNKLGIEHQTQAHVYGYYPDILLARYKLVIEVDGSVHNKPEVAKRDKKRQEDLEKLGYTVLRYSNNAISKSLPGVVANIRAKISYIETQQER